MHKHTRNWIIFTIAIYIVMFILIPPKKGPKLSPYGFYFGLIHAIILNWFAVRTYRLWKLPGDILVYGIPILTCISWIPPSIIFAYYYPHGKSIFWKTGTIILHAFGTTVVQYIQGSIGMWESKRWKPIYTFPLAILTHIIMTLGFSLFKIQDIRNS